MDITELKKCLGRFATGVTVVTASTGDALHGITVNSFTSVSLDPPLVLVSIEKDAKACEFLEQNHFAVNVLPMHQKVVATHFAGRPQPDAVIEWEEGSHAPRLVGALATIECSLWDCVTAGDHQLFIGKVENFQTSEGDPLIFYLGRFHPGPEALGGAGRTELGPSRGWLGDEAVLEMWPGVLRRSA